MRLTKVTNQSFKKRIIEDEKFAEEFILSEKAQLKLLILVKNEHVKQINLRIRLAGSDTQAQITGIVFGQKTSNLTLNTHQIHEAPNTQSDLLVKSVLTDQANFNYLGTVLITKRGSKTDAYQRNENLLVSDRAVAESRPELEILANDVRCTHGATIGTIPEDELWYLNSRGLPKIKAQNLIIQGFLESAISRISDKIDIENIRSYLWLKQ